MAHHHHHHRKRNPFAAGSMNQLAVKVAGGFGGVLAASMLPNLAGGSIATGWGGFGLALVTAFGGAYLLKEFSANVAEGWLIGGTMQAASRAYANLTGRTLLTASLGQYGPLNFTIPTPAYQSQPAIAASASKTSGGRAAASPQAAAAMGMLGARRAYSKYVS